MGTSDKSSVAEIRARFDAEVDRFSNLAAGQATAIDSALCMELIAQAAAAANPRASLALDVGCGAGNYSLKLREYLPHARFTLVDLSEPMIERARMRLGASVDASHVTDIREIDFAAGSFDVILAAAVLHHLRTPLEWEQTFAKFHRWLNPSGGLWIFDFVSHEHSAVNAQMWARFGQYLEAQGGDLLRERVFAYVEHEDTPTPLTYQLELLRKAGFARVDVLHKNSCFAAYGAVR